MVARTSPSTEFGDRREHRTIFLQYAALSRENPPPDGYRVMPYAVIEWTNARSREEVPCVLLFQTAMWGRSYVSGDSPFFPLSHCENNWVILWFYYQPEYSFIHEDTSADRCRGARSAVFFASRHIQHSVWQVPRSFTATGYSVRIR